MSDDSDISGMESDTDSVDDIIAKFKREDPDSDNEGIFDIVSDIGEDEDDDDKDKPYFPDKYEIMAKKEEMASDLEDSEEEDDEKGLPDAKQWGSKKADYYSSDYVDTGRRHKIDPREEGMAAAEEAEAIAIQKRLMSEMKDVDLGLDFGEELQDGRKDASAGNEGLMSVANSHADDEDDEEGLVERVKMNTDGLSDREKEQLLRRLHPELIPILEDFKSYLKESSEVLEPIINFCKTQEGRTLKSASGFHVINLKYRLIKAYVETIAQYFLLKCQSVDVKKHSITSRLFNFKKLIREVEVIMTENSLKKEMKLLASKINSNQVIAFNPIPESEESEQLLREIDIDHQLAVLSAGGLAAASGSSASRDAGGEEDDDRRGVTSEMKTNRGMTAVRKKEIKNPRVKHRVKYAKAVVRRKGQVRAPRKEITRYAGEITGIKGNLVRSIKFKH